MILIICILNVLTGLFIMTKLKVINVGPNEWFSPHFAFNDDHIEAFNYDPWKSNISLVEYCERINPDILYVFRGDIVRSQLYRLMNIYQIEFSSEIFPTNPFSNKHSQWLGVKKFMHCMKDIFPYSNMYHYDISRKRFLDAMNLSVSYHFLPVNTSPFSNPCQKDIDLLFFGRASHRRIKIFSKLKETNYKFVWIENGLNWSELSSYISRAKVVLNFAADECDNFEPRILLGLAGGSRVITEGSVGLDMFMNERLRYNQLIKIVKPDSSAILDAFNSLKSSEDLESNHLVNTSELSSNSFIIKDINSERN